MTQQPILFFRGKPGVGKTAFSNALGRDLGLAVLRKDDVYDALSTQIESHELKSQLSYDVLQQQILTQVSNGNGVIVDSSLHHTDHIQTFLAWAQSHRVPLITILIICSNEALWAERFNQRALNPTPNQLITHFGDLKQFYGDLNTVPLDGELVIDSAEDFEKNIGKIKAWIQTHT